MEPKSSGKSKKLMSMDKLAESCGTEVVDFRSKTKCCGGPFLLSKQDVAFELTKKLLDEAKSLGAGG